MEKKVSRGVSCDACGKQFPKSAYLQQHKRYCNPSQFPKREHAIETESDIPASTIDDLISDSTCNACGKVFTKPRYVKQHRRFCSGRREESDEESNDESEDSGDVEDVIPKKIHPKNTYL